MIKNTRARTGIDIADDEVDDVRRDYPSLTITLNDPEKVVADGLPEATVEGDLDAIIQLLRFVYGDDVEAIAYHVYYMEHLEKEDHHDRDSE